MEMVEKIIVYLVNVLNCLFLDISVNVKWYKHTNNAEVFISANAGTQNIASPIPDTASEMPFNHRVLKF